AEKGATCRLAVFFSSRRRHTSFSRDWSSDVCSSDLEPTEAVVPTQPTESPVIKEVPEEKKKVEEKPKEEAKKPVTTPKEDKKIRSEERRVGKECRYRWAEERKKERYTREVTTEVVVK